MPAISKNLEIAIIAGLEAGQAIMEVYNTAFSVEIKDDKSPLTEADKKSSDIIDTYLVKTTIPVISEEIKQKPFAERQDWNQCWIVDPLDGTKEFIKRNGEFTVNIAMVEHGSPILGVIYVPFTQTLFFADVAQKQAYKASLTSHNESVENILKISRPIIPLVNNTNTLKVVGSRSHMNQDTKDFIQTLSLQDKHIEIVSRGSSLKFCLVAEGEADIYPRFAPTMEWDTAAGQAICNAVGIEVISTQTNAPLLYNKENLLNPWFVVSKKSQ